MHKKDTIHYHAMGCNPVSMVDLLGLQYFAPATPVINQDPSAFARMVAPTLGMHLPGGSLWGLSNMSRYISSLPKDLQAEAWMMYLSGGGNSSSFDLAYERFFWHKDIQERKEAGKKAYGGSGSIWNFMLDEELEGDWRVDEVKELENQIFYQKANGTYGSASIWNAVVELKNQSDDVKYPWIKKINDIYGMGTFMPAIALSFVGTKTGKLLSMGGTYVWKASTYSAQRGLVRELSYGSKAIKAVGTTVGYGGLVITGVDMYMNGVNTSNSMDAVMGIVSFIPGWGWVAGGVYFISNTAVEAATGKNIGQYIDELIY